MSDKVYISGLEGSAIAGVDHWQKPVPHPVLVDVAFSTDFSRASDSDNLQYSLNYAVISDKISSFLKKSHQRNFQSLGGVAEAVFDLLLTERAICTSVDLKVLAPKLDIRAPVSYTFSGPQSGTYHIEGLRALTLIGVFTFERLNKQFVLLDIDMSVPSTHLNVPRVSESVHDYLEQANFKTVEALVKRTSQWILQNFAAVESVSVRVTKPNAIVYTEGVGVSCLCTRAEFAGEEPISISGASKASEAFDLPVESKTVFSGSHTAYIAFGSNEGNQLGHIRLALEILNGHERISVKSTSSLYVSKPMYYTNQPDFYNGVFKITVHDMTPHELLLVLKDIEYGKLARVKDFENGPRSIDLDIILFDDVTVNSPDLVVPHKSMLDRTFVLQPLCELLNPDFLHPVTAEPIHNHLKKLLNTPTDPSVQESSELDIVIPGTSGRHLRFNINGKLPTAIMGIFNATPDLFSDGGDKYHLEPSQIVAAVLKMKEQGADVIDVGGVSTRPGSVEPLVEEELRRVIPVVQAIRQERLLDDILISVDTYRAQVADQAVAAGADIINDISMGTFDDELIDVVAKHGCGYIMSHTRGTPATMSKLTEYNAGPTSLIEYSIDPRSGLLPPLMDVNVIHGVCRELALQIQAAMDRGVKKWQIILDPGVGFAKDLKQNLEILRHAKRFKQYAQIDLDKNLYLSFHGMGLLIGTSRKKFLGTLTGQAVADQRVIATAATVVASIEQSADMVRVHDVEEVKQAVQTGDAIYRGIYPRS
ncbi:CIC11C00000001196 [Sungouiella intermedia]|uniref:CIC11C00000001196 n=1 Tax=Sungouiella intermedia TaxID=45354 RepID=A0A1L0BKG9_9ASCO|nr:CIC11C00000001196 [[Candida] intermedia]